MTKQQWLTWANKYLDDLKALADKVSTDPSQEAVDAVAAAIGTCASAIAAIDGVVLVSCSSDADCVSHGSRWVCEGGGCEPDGTPIPPTE